ncbi:hypothetical protein BV25DRAFT_1842705 [Artomyces pyxidatus]|uniref:Uncharacterized protein n=1 Tax=Artomyces pyxidatus TaxID=48021 RepID=A0ACB8SJB8_9AGAM|nr:hypothetical protein BV25DRAFT_1842705 [Artomyces pyxidatus]
MPRKCSADLSIFFFSLMSMQHVQPSLQRKDKFLTVLPLSNISSFPLPPSVAMSEREESPSPPPAPPFPHRYVCWTWSSTPGRIIVAANSSAIPQPLDNTLAPTTYLDGLWGPHEWSRIPQQAYRARYYALAALPPAPARPVRPAGLFGAPSGAAGGVFGTVGGPVGAAGRARRRCWAGSSVLFVGLVGAPSMLLCCALGGIVGATGGTVGAAGTIGAVGRLVFAVVTPSALLAVVVGAAGIVGIAVGLAALLRWAAGALIATLSMWLSSALLARAWVLAGLLL